MRQTANNIFVVFRHSVWMSCVVPQLAQNFVLHWKSSEKKNAAVHRNTMVMLVVSKARVFLLIEKMRLYRKSSEALVKPIVNGYSRRNAY